MEFSPVPRKRGGQPGNKNAQKHGFYTARLRPAETEDLKDLEPVNLVGEIELIRVFLRRLLEEAAVAPADISRHIELLRVICLASQSLTRLIRTQHLIFPDTDLVDSLRALAEEVRKELEGGPYYMEDEEDQFIDMNLAGPADLS